MSGRTVVNISDVTLALDDMRHDVDSLITFQNTVAKPQQITPPEVGKFPNYSQVLKHNPTSANATIELTADATGKQFFRVYATSDTGSLSTIPTSVASVEGVLAKPEPHIPPYLPLFPFIHTYAKGAGLISGRLKSLSRQNITAKQTTTTTKSTGKASKATTKRRLANSENILDSKVAKLARKKKRRTGQ